jgi:hypothetical protein
MSALAKAMLMELKGDKPVDGSEIPVQFNPQSLKLALANKVEGGDTRARQRRQYLGKTSTTLSFDLHFDTADEGTTDEPVSVRTRTASVERFVLPKGQGNQKQAPPKVRFHWDKLIIDGVIEDVAIDFDLFAANGTPLRAKIGVSIKEQDAKYELLKAGPGANQPGNPTPPGSSDTTATALGGESAADFAARMGLEPEAWRGIAAQLGASSSLSLQAGAEIDFSSSLSIGAGIGLSAGLEVGADVSLEASFGLDASVSASVGVSFGASAEVQAGFAMAAAGGLSAAIAAVAVVETSGAAAQTRNAFGSAAPIQAPTVPGSATSSVVSPALLALAPAASNTPSRPPQRRAPLRSTNMPSPSAQASAPSAPPPPTPDPRATSFGFGVPLRPRVSVAADLRNGSLAGAIVLKPRAAVLDVIVPDSPSTPPWTRLPPPDAARASADRVQAQRGPSRLACGCGGVCRGACECGCGCQGRGGLR